MVENLRHGTKHQKKELIRPTQSVPLDDERAVLATLASAGAPTTLEEAIADHESKGQYYEARILKNVLARKHKSPSNPQLEMDFGDQEKSGDKPEK